MFSIGNIWIDKNMLSYFIIYDGGDSVDCIVDGVMFSSSTGEAFPPDDSPDHSMEGLELSHDFYHVDKLDMESDYVYAINCDDAYEIVKKFLIEKENK